MLLESPPNACVLPPRVDVLRQSFEIGPSVAGVCAARPASLEGAESRARRLARPPGEQPRAFGTGVADEPEAADEVAAGLGIY